MRVEPNAWVYDSRAMYTVTRATYGGTLKIIERARFKGQGSHWQKAQHFRL